MYGSVLVDDNCMKNRIIGMRVHDWD